MLMKKHIRKLTLFLVMVSFNFATATVIDFTTDDNGVPLVNGQEIATPGEFGNLVSISALNNIGGNSPLAIFDTDPAGPNAANAAAHSTGALFVDLGNALVFQHTRTYSAQTVPGIFDAPVHAADSGTMFFDFTSPSTLTSIDLIDIDAGSLPGNRNATVTMTDINGLTRVYDVPAGFTHSLTHSPNGWATLDLTTLADQTGETALLATATEEAGFDAAAVAQLAVRLRGSGGVDNLVFAVPEPASLGLVGLGMLALIARRAIRS